MLYCTLQGKNLNALKAHHDPQCRTLHLNPKGPVMLPVVYSCLREYHFERRAMQFQCCDIFYMLIDKLEPKSTFSYDPESDQLRPSQQV